MQFQNRHQAGVLIVQKLNKLLLDKDNTLIIAHPPGGIPIAHEIATSLHLPIDIILLKKIGAPSYPELTIGIIDESGEVFYNENLLSELGFNHNDINQIREQALSELKERSFLLRQGKSPISLSSKDIIVVDDGIATGATMNAIIQILKKRNVRKIIVVAPVISADTLIKFETKVDQIISLITPNPIYSIGEWYENFIPVDNEEIINTLISNRTQPNTA